MTEDTRLRSRSTATGSPVQAAAALVGGAFVLVGVLGFIPGITADRASLQAAGHGSHAELLGVFQVSILHNVVHLLLGATGIALARTATSARAFLLGGNGWDDKPMAPNVRRIGHVGTRDHNAFNTSSLAVLNVARDSMASTGYSPATRVFEAAGAGVSLFATSNVAYPPLPLFAAIPAEMPQWAPVLLIVPAAVLAHAFVVKPLSLESVAAAATWAALMGALLGIFSAGGAGAYGLVGADPFALALSLFIWVALTGALVRGVALVRQRASARSGS